VYVEDYLVGMLEVNPEMSLLISPLNNVDLFKTKN
jgi:hypothetical protein